MATAFSSDTAKTLRDTVTMVRKVEAADAKVQPQYKKMSDGLRAGIDNGSEDEIGLYRPQLARLSGAIDSVLGSIKDFPKLARILNNVPGGKWPDELARLAGSLKLKETDGRKLATRVGKARGMKKPAPAKKDQLIDL